MKMRIGKSSPVKKNKSVQLVQSRHLDGSSLARPAAVFKPCRIAASATGQMTGQELAELQCEQPNWKRWSPTIPDRRIMLRHAAAPCGRKHRVGTGCERL